MKHSMSNDYTITQPKRNYLKLLTWYHDFWTCGTLPWTPLSIHIPPLHPWCAHPHVPRQPSQSGGLPLPFCKCWCNMKAITRWCWTREATSALTTLWIYSRQMYALWCLRASRRSFEIIQLSGGEMEKPQGKGVNTEHTHSRKCMYDLQHSSLALRDSLFKLGNRTSTPSFLAYCPRRNDYWINSVPCSAQICQIKFLGVQTWHWHWHLMQIRSFPEYNLTLTLFLKFFPCTWSDKWSVSRLTVPMWEHRWESA